MSISLLRVLIWGSLAGESLLERGNSAFFQDWEANGASTVIHEGPFAFVKLGS